MSVKHTGTMKFDLFERLYIREPESGCWLWRARLDKDGYGRFGKTSLAHRSSYEFYRQPIPKGQHIDHLCFVRRCVNPWHMRIVSPDETVKQGCENARLRKIAKRTHKEPPCPTRSR